MPSGPCASRDNLRGRYYDAFQEEYSLVTEALHDAIYLVYVCCLLTTAQYGYLPRCHPLLRSIHLRRL